MAQKRAKRGPYKRRNPRKPLKTVIPMHTFLAEVPDEFADDISKAIHQVCANHTGRGRPKLEEDEEGREAVATTLVHLAQGRRKSWIVKHVPGMRWHKICQLQYEYEKLLNKWSEKIADDLHVELAMIREGRTMAISAVLDRIADGDPSIGAKEIKELAFAESQLTRSLALLENRPTQITEERKTITVEDALRMREKALGAIKEAEVVEVSNE